MRCGFCFAGSDGTCDCQRLLFRFELFSDLGADAHQVRASSLRVAPAERESHASFGLVGDGDATARRIESDDVAHQHVGAEIAGTPDAVASSDREADQRIAHGLDGFLWPFQRHLQVGQQHVECRLAV